MSAQSPLRILHVASHAGVYRGGAIQLCRMAIEQRRRGHVVVAAANSRREGDPERAAQDRESWAPLREAGVPVLFFDHASWRERLRLRQLLVRERFDVLHAHRDEALAAAWWACWGLRRPVLVAQRGTIWAPPWTVRRIFASRRTRAVLAVSHAVREALSERVPPVARKIRVVYGSVDLFSFAPRPADRDLKESLDLPSGAAIIGSLSAYHRGKGLEILLRALVPVFATHHTAHALFLGEGTTKRLRPLAAELGIAGRCRFVGRQTDVARWLSVMDLTVVAAHDREGLSGVLRESLAMEIPVISTDCAGNREIVRDRQSGLLVPERDTAALSAALDWALANPESMKAMARAGRRWVEEHCAPARQAEQLEAAYRHALADAR